MYIRYRYNNNAIVDDSKKNIDLTQHNVTHVTGSGTIIMVAYEEYHEHRKEVVREVLVLDTKHLDMYQVKP